MPTDAIDASGAPCGLLKAYFRKVAIWSVAAVPVGFGVILLGMGAASFFVGDLRANTDPIPFFTSEKGWSIENMNHFALIGITAALALLAPLVAVFARGWKRARTCGKGRLGSFGVACGGFALAVVMSAAYLGAACALAWLLFTKA